MRGDNIKVKVIVDVRYQITFWQALKLRLAGKNYKYVAEELIHELKEKLK